jgi:3',5'-cyclic AMP phosphodiesterase CpdA
MKPAPDLVLFAGDLAHDGDAKALALGKEILADLSSPILAVRGEGDGPAENSTAWNRLFGKAPFVYSRQGVNMLGIETVVRPTGSQGPSYFTFALGEAQCRWLAHELRRLDPGLPLIILSHAPLTPIFQPWQQWTADADRVAPLLAHFRRVLFLHGHVHQTGVRWQVAGMSGRWPVVSGQEQPDGPISLKPVCFTPKTENRKPKTENLPIPATAWPLPSPLQGTPRRLTPGLAPHSCGWGLIALNHDACDFQTRLWQA